MSNSCVGVDVKLARDVHFLTAGSLHFLAQAVFFCGANDRFN